MKERSIKNKLLIVATVAMLCSTSFFMMNNTESNAAGPATVPPTALGTIGVSFSYSTGYLPYDLEVLEYTGLPPGLSFIQSTGRVTGTPASVGIYTVTFYLCDMMAVDFWYEQLTIIISTPDNSPESYTVHKNKIERNSQCKVYASSSMAYMSTVWNPGTSSWLYTYRMAGIGHADGYYGKIRVAGIHIEDTLNKPNMSCWSNPSPEYIGSTPNSNYIEIPEYVDLAAAVIGLAITAIGSMGASLIWSLATLILSLRSQVNEQTNTPDCLERIWHWSPDIRDTGQFLWFLANVKPNQTVQFSYEYALFGPEYEYLSSGKGYRTIHAGPVGKSSLSMNPEQMTASEREQCGIETIQRENLLTRAAELNISEITLNEWLDSDQDVFYFTNNFVEYEAPQPERVELNKSNLTKDLLLDELSEQMNRSEKIIRAFSMDGICNLEDSIEIVQKHTTQLASLLELQAELENIQKTNIIKLNSVFDSYCDIISVGSKVSKTI